MRVYRWMRIRGKQFAARRLDNCAPAMVYKCLPEQSQRVAAKPPGKAPQSVFNNQMHKGRPT
jgi:hypothetical protein